MTSRAAAVPAQLKRVLTAPRPLLARRVELDVRVRSIEMAEDERTAGRPGKIGGKAARRWMGGN